MIYFDGKLPGFLDSKVHEIPKWAKPIDDAAHSKILAGSRPNYTLSSDKNGDPVFVPIAQTPDDVANYLVKAKSELRAIRAPMLDALAGIAGRAARSGNDALAKEADELAVKLLSITDDAALNAATTHAAMQAAGVAVYKRMASGASTELSVVFREITGA